MVGEEFSESVRPHVVILVHGIRTRAPWYIEVRDVLNREGFQVALTNYGRFDLVRFLVPLPFFKSRAAADIERDIRSAMARHNVDSVSVVAHSFGTYIVAWILKNRFDIRFRRMIFCGSVVPFRFPFQNYTSRFEGDLLNEVGTADIWPILAESVTWGYGSTGAFGFNRPGVFDRYHKGVAHSAFLNAAFCREYWVPVLNGNRPVSIDKPEKPSMLLQILSVIHFKHVLLSLIAFAVSFWWCLAPARTVFIQTADVFFAGDTITRLVAEAEQPCSQGCPEFMQCRRCMMTTAMESAVEDLVICHVQKTSFTYRDPAVALETLQKSAISCLQVDGVADRRLEVKVNKTLADAVNTSTGRALWLCGCDQDARADVLEMSKGRR